MTPSKRKAVALWLLIAPSALIVFTMVLYIIVNAVAGNSYDSATDSFTAFANILIFLVSLVGFISWLPGIIVGIVLLASKPTVVAQTPQTPPTPPQEQ